MKAPMAAPGLAVDAAVAWQRRGRDAAAMPTGRPLGPDLEPGATLTGDQPGRAAAVPATVVLLQPPVGMFDTIARNIPLGLLAVARYLDPRYRVVIIDQRFADWRARLDAVLADPAAVVCAGFTVLTGTQIRFAVATARELRCRAPSIPIVFGGIHPTLLPEQTLAEQAIDYVVIGDGELTFRDLVDALAERRDPAALSGIAYRDDGGTPVVTPRREAFDVRTAPRLPYHLLDLPRYLGRSAQNHGEAFLVEGGRGCVHHCTFCFNSGVHRHTWRPFTVAAILDQITHLNRQHDVRGFFIVDDSFFIDRRRAFDFAQALVDAGLGIEWCAEANLSDIQRLRDAEWRLLERSGLSWLSVGVESGSPRILKHLRKNVRIPRLLDFNRRIARFDIRVRYNFMTGYIWDDDASIGETIDLCLRLTAGTPRIMVQPLYISTPLPGTEYLGDAERHGFETPTTLAAWSEFDPFHIAGRLPWLGRRRALFEMLMYTSFFIDAKPAYHANDSPYGRVIRWLGRLYRPLARWRFRHRCSWLFVEKYYFRLAEWRLRRRYRAHHVR